MTNAIEHQGRVAVITGGSGGIGGAIAARLTAEGAVVHVLDVNPGADDTRFHAVDVGDEASVNQVIDAIGAAHGAIDYLVCCAGIYQPQPFLELTLDAWRQTLQINLTGMFLSCRAALKYMTPRRFGRIVLFSSMAARTGGKNVAHYAASKGGILGLARALAVETAADNIRVNTISPVITDTAMPRAVVSDEYMQSRKQHIPLGRIGEVPDMVEACLFLLSDDSSYIVGQDLRVNGGSTLW
ncbi:MAG TPA: SDR family NAD(P)-dependent oxidoreductase [Candidatus Limnocylindria bacterium]|nr:SDR family NAD(P)-dependent oxidoreductase [Candidatus Limnocylindria bacterium]